MANEHTREGRFKRDHGGFALAGIILAYFASPLLGKSDPVLLLILGGSLGLTVLSAYERKVMLEKTRWNGVTLVGSLVVAVLCFITVIASAAPLVSKLNRQCASLQNEMLNGRPAGSPAPPVGRSDPADAFQALGCRAR
jgi:hypothetical protein